MRRCLVVANQTLGSEELLREIGRQLAEGPCHFHLLVPATTPGDLDPVQPPAGAESPGADLQQQALERKQARQLLEDELDEPSHAESGEHAGRRLARQRLGEGLARLREAGADASGEVGVPDPFEAVGVVLHRWEFDAIILSTLPERRSRWLARDLPTRIRRAYKLPVTQVTGAANRGG